MRVLPCFVIESKKSLEWLGDRPAWIRGWEALKKIRGVLPGISFLAAESVHAEAHDALRSHNLVPGTIPDKLLSRGFSDTLQSWLLAHEDHQGADAILYLTANVPFLPPGKLEAGVRHVARSKANVGVFSREARVVLRGCVQNANEIVSGCRVFVAKPSKALEPTRDVSVSLIESLDITKHDEFVLAAALVETGRI